MAKVQTSTYLVIEPRWSHTGKRVVGLRVVNCRVTKPRLGRNQYAIKVNLEMPEEAFKRMIPEVGIEVLADQLVRPQVAVADPEHADEFEPTGGTE